LTTCYYCCRFRSTVSKISSHAWDTWCRTWVFTFHLYLINSHDITLFTHVG